MSGNFSSHFAGTDLCFFSFEIDLVAPFFFSHVFVIIFVFFVYTFVCFSVRRIKTAYSCYDLLSQHSRGISMIAPVIGRLMYSISFNLFY